MGVGTVFASTVKDAGMTTKREFEITELERPGRIRWTERSKNMVTVPDGGYDLESVSDGQTKVTIRNTLEGHGFGKLIVGFAARSAVKDAPNLAHGSRRRSKEREAQRPPVTGARAGAKPALAATSDSRRRRLVR